MIRAKYMQCSQSETAKNVQDGWRTLRRMVGYILRAAIA